MTSIDDLNDLNLRTFILSSIVLIIFKTIYYYLIIIDKFKIYTLKFITRIFVNFSDKKRLKKSFFII